MEKFITSLGVYKGEPDSRVWIEGQRLNAAGFKVGATYTKKFNKVTIVLTLDKGGKLKVSQRGMTPIIDLSGKKVREFFEGYSRVEVTYRDGTITYRGVK